MSDRWIVIHNWDRFQHYGNRNPIWVKNYVSLLRDPDYLALSATQRGLLHGLWMLYAQSQRLVPLDLTLLNRALGLSAKQSTLDALNHAGFIEFADSKPIARRYQAASPEVEVLRTSTKSAASATAHKGGGRSSAENGAALLDMNTLGERLKCPQCGLERKTARQLAEHIYISHDGPEPDHWIEAERLADR